MKGKSKFKKLISFLLVLMIIISTVPMSVSAAAAESVSDVTEKVGEAAKDAAASLGYMVLDAGTQLGRQNLQQASVVNKMLSDAKGAVVSAANTLGSAVTRAATEGTYGDFKYRVLKDGTAMITDYTGFAKELVIPSEMNGYKVTRIGDSAFYTCLSLTNITIPDSVTNIGNEAFVNCIRLTNITIPDSVTNIGDEAFSLCTSLKNIKIPNGIEYIRKSTFSQCGSLTNVTIPDSVTSIESSAFYNCESLTNIIIPDSVTSIGGTAFSGCTSLKNIKIPNGVKEISGSTFSGCTSLTDITIPNSVTSIGSYVFSGCTSLTSITIPASVKEINSGVFEDCTSLTDITIPDSVTIMRGYMFSGCTSLKKITIPDNVKTIEWSVFSDCTSLTDITIPNSVTSIGSSVFSGCKSLKNITVDSENTSYSDINGVLFDKEQNVLIQYPEGKNDVSYIIPNSVRTIEDRAFSGCTHLKNIRIPDSVSYIGTDAFSGCTSLTAAVIPNGVTAIQDRSFSNCISLTEVVIPDSVITIQEKAFFNCTSLTEVIIPDGVTTIQDSAFSCCTSLTEVMISDSVTKIQYLAFYNCTSLTDIYYSGSEDEWKQIIIGTSAIPSNVTIHYNSLQLRFSEQFIFLNEGDSCDLKVFFGDKDVTLETTFENFNKDTITMSADGKITARSEGVARIYGTYNSGGERYGADCYVCVGAPNAMNLTAKYDSKYYAYDGGGFYSTSSSVSDSIDLYLLMENAVRSELGHLVNPEDYPEYFKDIEPITLTAQISGSGLSFSPDTYQNTYTATYETIPVDYAVDDLLSLYPWNLDLNLSGNNYTVTVTLTSESFAPITENYSFTVTSEAAESVQNHLRFMAGNKDYNVLRQNIYGSSMIELKNDPEYIWSKYSTLDFDNYYDIVLADILIKILDVKQIEMPSLIPDFVKDCVSNFKTVTSGLKVIINDSYDEVLDLSEQEVGKILKKSKYKEDDTKFTDKVYKAVLEHCSKPANKEKIEKVVGSMKGAGKFISAVKFGANVIKSVVDWGNRLALLNAFSNADQAFKNVMKTFADTIPSSEYKMKESVYDYINYSQDWSGKMSEIQEITDKLLFDVSIEVLKKMIGKSFFEFVGYNVLGWLGMSTISGGTAVFASTAAFSGVSSAFGAFFTGVSLGLCLSDHLCDSSGKSEEMSKIVAMSEYSTYITNMLYYYEQKLWNDAVHATEETGSVEAAVATVDEFEYAFLLHKTSQSYIMEHTVSALEKKAGSIIGRLLDRNDYQTLIGDILAQKSTVNSLRCHTDSLEEPTEVTQTKVVAIHCPVDVFVTGADGSELVRIVNDTVEYAAEGINVIVVDGEKYIAVPADQKFDIKIVAREAGSMSYSVTEYAEGAQRVQTVGISEITLKNGAEFNADIPQGINNSSENYSIEENGTIILPDEIITIPVTGIEIDKNLLNLNVGEMYKLNAAVLPSDASNQNVIWYSDNPSVASVDENGKVTAISNGQTTIYAVSEEWGYMAACTVTVSGGSGSITVDLNGDGKVTAIDARWVLQIAAGIREVTEEEKVSIDLNKDGKVTAIDARWVLQIAAGIRKIP